MPRALLWIAIATAAASGACTASARPVALDTHTTLCEGCRMPVSDAKLAFQLVAPGEEPLFFDDAACVRGFLTKGAPRPGSALFVTDHRSGAWIPAASAIFSRVPAIETPMNSHVIAHESDASARADTAASGGTRVAAADVFGVAELPNGGR